MFASARVISAALVAIVGAHILLYTAEAAEVRAILRDVLGWEFVEEAAVPGWLIFKLPPAEVGVHPTQLRALRLMRCA